MNMLEYALSPHFQKIFTPFFWGGAVLEVCTVSTGEFLGVFLGTGEGWRDGGLWAAG